MKSLKRKCRAQIRIHAWGPIHHQSYPYIWSQTWAQLWNQIERHVWNQVWDQIFEEIQGEK